MRDQLNTIAEKFNNEVTGRIADQVSTATKFTTEANDRVLDTIVDVNRKAVDFAVKTAEKAPTFELPFELPMADKFEIPTPAQAGKNYIDAVERLAEMNRDFSDRIVAMLPSDKPAVAKKPAAKKAPAKKKAPARKASAKK